MAAAASSPLSARSTGDRPSASSVSCSASPSPLFSPPRSRSCRSAKNASLSWLASSHSSSAARLPCLPRQRLVLAAAVDASQVPADRRARDTQSQAFGSGAFEMVRLVEDHHAMRRQVRGAGDAQREIGEVQRVVDDQHLCGLHAPPGALPVTAVEVLARPLQAVAVLGLHLLPDLRSRREVEVLARALARRQRPVDDASQLGVLLGILEQALLALGLMHASQAQVVVAADSGHRGPLERQHRVQERQVLLFELLLQRDRARRDHHGPVALVAVGVQGRRQQVREGLAGAGAGFGDEVAAVAQCRRNGLGESELLRAHLVVGEPARDRAVGAEQLGDVEGLVVHVIGSCGSSTGVCRKSAGSSMRFHCGRRRSCKTGSASPCSPRFSRLPSAPRARTQWRLRRIVAR